MKAKEDAIKEAAAKEVIKAKEAEMKFKLDAQSNAISSKVKVQESPDIIAI